MADRRSFKRTLVIGGYRVVFVPGEGWQCTCESMNGDEACPHIVQAAALITLEMAVIALGGSISRH